MIDRLWSFGVHAFAVIGVASTLAGFIKLFYEAWGWISRRIWRQTSEEIVARRTHIKDELYAKLPKADEHGVHGEAILRDLRHLDGYPENKRRLFGGYPSHKVEIKGVYDDGLEVFVNMGRYIVQQTNGSWKECEHETIGKVFVLPVGRIPGENIVSVDWTGSRYDSGPQIFCHFDGIRGTPYKEIVWYQDSKFDYPRMIQVPNYRPKLSSLLKYYLTSIRDQFHK